MVSDFSGVQGDGIIPPGEQTESWITYDKDNIYIAFRCLDSDAKAIQAFESIKDYRFKDGVFTPTTEDTVIFRIDPYLAHNAESLSS